MSDDQHNDGELHAKLLANKINHVERQLSDQQQAQAQLAKDVGRVESKAELAVSTSLRNQEAIAMLQEKVSQSYEQMVGFRAEFAEFRGELRGEMNASASAEARAARTSRIFMWVIGLIVTVGIAVTGSMLAYF